MFRLWRHDDHAEWRKRVSSSSRPLNLFNQRDISDFEVEKKRERIFKMSWTDWKIDLPIWLRGLLVVPNARDTPFLRIGESSRKCKPGKISWYLTLDVKKFCVTSHLSLVYPPILHAFGLRFNFYQKHKLFSFLALPIDYSVLDYCTNFPFIPPLSWTYGENRAAVHFLSFGILIFM